MVMVIMRKSIAQKEELRVTEGDSQKSDVEKKMSGVMKMMV